MHRLESEERPRMEPRPFHFSPPEGFIEGLTNDEGLQVEGESRTDPEYRGVFDATDAVSWDACEDQA